MRTAQIHTDISVAPKSAEGFMVTTSDGVDIRVGLWRTEQDCRGTALLFPGRGDYIELYGHPVSALVAAGFNALVIDWRGHGLSGRVANNPKVGHIGSFSEYQNDVKTMIECVDELELEKPLFVVGHSMGACVALRSLIEGLEVKAAAFSAPMFEIYMASYERAAAWPLTWFLRTIGKGQMYAPGFNDDSYVFKHQFEDNNLTNSREEYERWIMQGTKCPELHTGGPSMGWLYAALKECHDLSKLPSPDIPCLTFCGDKEQTVGVSAIRERLVNWPTGHFEQVHDAKHELFLELPEVREKVIGKIISFFCSFETSHRGISAV